MPEGAIQAITYVEAVLLLLANGAGAVLASLARRVSEVDVREARAWEPSEHGTVERARLRHNRLVVTEDARFGETCRLVAHGLIAVVGLFWLLTPQPINPVVVWWAVAIRAVVVALSLLLIAKTLHHLGARWRFDRPWARRISLAYALPGLVLAWRDARPTRAQGTARP